MVRIVTRIAVLLWCAAAAQAVAASHTAVRVATLCPLVTDALATAGERAEIVASVRRNPTTPVSGGIADLGTPHTPNLEVLVASGARLVVADRSMHAPLVPRLESQGLEVVLVDTSSVDGTFASLLALGERVGAGADYAKSVAGARESLDAVKPRRPERVLALLGMPTSFFVMTSRSWQGDLLARIGFENVAGSVVGEERIPGFVPLSDEILAGLAPERVLLVAHGDPEAVRTAFERRLQDRGLLRATSGGVPPRIEILSPDRFLSNPGIALPELARDIVAGPSAPASAQ